MVEKNQEGYYADLMSPAPVLRQWFIKSSNDKIEDQYRFSEKEVYYNSKELLILNKRNN